MVVGRESNFFVSGGTLPLDASSYVERNCDQQLFEALRNAQYCYVLNSRQMGKSSLSIRTLAKLEQMGWCTVSIDLTQMGGRNVTPDQWYIGMAAELGRVLGLRAEILAYWKAKSEFGPMRRFFGALREVVLEKVEQPIVLCIDEIDATRNLPFDTDEFFAGIRECFNRRVQDPAFQRLTFCILGVAVPSDLIRNPTTTPFNIGERVYLRDFTVEEMRRLASALGPNGDTLIERVHYWTGGHPFLSQSLCAAIAADPAIQTSKQVDDLIEKELFGPKARDRNVNLADVANRALNAGFAEPDPERFRADLLSAYARALKGKPVTDDEANRVASLLKLSGLVRSDGMRLRPRNRIYQRVFDAEWIQENMPGQELLRLQQSFRRGIIRATAAYAAVLATVAAFGIFAWTSQRRAEAATVALDRELYIADMNNLRLFEENGDTPRIAQILERTKNSPYRSIEWGLWMKRLHDAKEEYTLDYRAPGKRENGYLTWDGRLICLTDDVTMTATVIDRTSKRTICTRNLTPTQQVVATKTGFLTVDTQVTPAPVVDLISRKELRRIGNPDGRISTLETRPNSDIVLTLEELPNKVPGGRVDLWNLTTGHQTFCWGGPGLSIELPVAFSRDGSRVLITPGRGAGKAGLRNVVVMEPSSHREVDRFTLEDSGAFYDLSDSGKYLLYGDGKSGTIGRDVDRHETIYRRLWSPGETRTAGCFSDGEQKVVTLDRTGKAIVEEFPTGNPLGTILNIWNLSGTASSSEIVAASASVRLFDLRNSVGPRILGQGDRIGRNGQNNLAVFQVSPRGLLRFSDPGLVQGRLSPAPAHFRGYTYNGRWQVEYTKGAAQATIFTDPFSDAKPIRLPMVPINFSGGIARDVFAILMPQTSDILGISGETGEVLWKYHAEGWRNGLWVSPRGDSVFAFVGAAALLVLDAHTGKVRARLERHNLRITNLTFSADGKSFFTCGADGRAVLWDMASLTEKMEFQGNVAQRIGGADLSPDGKRVVTANDGGSWQLWDAVTGVQLADMKASNGSVRSILFTADGKKVVAACEDGKIRAWESSERDPSCRVPVSASSLKDVRR
ncbi:AAA-like domain-containing protein [Fimbriimonas ginsengisoli]|uniref:GUN4-like family n=1 Tax=Fimbriimonas ginsengisoli Gsoil 348 TaxID=661478 RepID=A0A068NPU4_FIMGI|nr:AAA-like domain-containing protein [Fimbriimonas ginsengisoli]AIE85543.1 GUN4-like family [Fimbriimonas ginsengisoli Gsoil 348]